jgi:hypothetical protein
MSGPWAKSGRNHDSAIACLVGELSSLAKEWLRITNGLLIVEDPEPAPRNLNKLMCVNGGEDTVVRAHSGSKRRHAKCVKLTPSQN